MHTLHALASDRPMFSYKNALNYLTDIDFLKLQFNAPRRANKGDVFSIASERLNKHRALCATTPDQKQSGKNLHPSFLRIFNPLWPDDKGTPEDRLNSRPPAKF